MKVDATFQKRMWPVPLVLSRPSKYGEKRTVYTSYAPGGDTIQWHVYRIREHALKQEMRDAGTKKSSMWQAQRNVQVALSQGVGGELIGFLCRENFACVCEESTAFW